MVVPRIPRPTIEVDAERERARRARAKAAASYSGPALNQVAEEIVRDLPTWVSLVSVNPFRQGKRWSLELAIAKLASWLASGRRRALPGLQGTIDQIERTQQLVEKLTRALTPFKGQGPRPQAIKQALSTAGVTNATLAQLPQIIGSRLSLKNRGFVDEVAAITAMELGWQSRSVTRRLRVYRQLAALKHDAASPRARGLFLREFRRTIRSSDSVGELRRQVSREVLVARSARRYIDEFHQLERERTRQQGRSRALRRM